MISFWSYSLQVDACAVKNAISSAVDVMQAMGSSVCCLLSKVKFHLNLQVK